jgi:hypothetical protein
VLTVSGSSKRPSANRTGGQSAVNSTVASEVGTSGVRLRTDRFRHTAFAGRSNTIPDAEARSFGSQEMIIQREDTVDVSYENGTVRQSPFEQP